MDTKDLKGLMEAYSEVHAPQEIDEAVKGANPEMRRAASAERRAGDKRLSPSKAKGYAAHAMQQAAYIDKKTKGKHIPGYAYAEEVEQIDELSVGKMLAYGKAAKKDRDVLNKKWDEKKASHKEKMRVLGHEEGEERASQKIKKKTGKYPHQMNALDKARYAVTKEELDIFDVVLEFLQAEGYAETLEEAEWMMVNELDSEDIDAIVIGEADSLAAFQARREKRRAAMKKKTGYEGHDYSKPHAQAAAEREQRMRDFLDKK